jgi:hypothetical protein
VAVAAGASCVPLHLCMQPCAYRRICAELVLACLRQCVRHLLTCNVRSVCFTAGWARDKYVWNVAVVAAQANIEAQPHGVSPLMVQPPKDHIDHRACMIHYHE